MPPTDSAAFTSWVQVQNNLTCRPYGPVVGDYTLSRGGGRFWHHPAGCWRKQLRKYLAPTDDQRRAAAWHARNRSCRSARVRPAQANSWLIELGNGDKFIMDFGSGSQANFTALEIRTRTLRRILPPICMLTTLATSPRCGLEAAASIVLAEILISRIFQQRVRNVY
jgi:hypothetical protein